MKIFVVFLILLFMSGCSQETTPQKENKVLSMSFSTKADFNPYTQSSNSAKIPLSFIYQPLYRITPVGDAAAVLAESVRTEDNKLFVTLKKNILFHDGSVLCAKDAAYSANLASGCGIAPSIIRADAVSQYEMIIHLSRSMENPQKLLTFPIIKESTLCGTGPYCYDAKTSFDTYRFKRFASYYGTPPSFDEIKIIIPKENRDEATLYKSGETDILYLTNPQLQQVFPRKNHEKLIIPTNHMLLIGFNCISLPPEVRRSIYLMYDKQSSVEASFGSSAIITPSYERPDSFAAEEELKSGGFTKAGGSYCGIGVVVQREDRFIKLGEDFKRRLDQFGFSCTITYSQDAVADFQKGLYDMIISPYNATDGVWDFVNKSNLLFYENHHLSTINDNIQINNILRRDMPFIFAAYLPDAVYAKPDLLSEIKSLSGGLYEKDIHNYTSRQGWSIP